jgi:hypothetical protein
MVVENLINELERMQLARKLLETVYLEIGPYKNGQISDETLDKLRRFFNFDDSE